MTDAVDRPHLVWWVIVLGGLTVLGLLGFNDAFYAWYTDALMPLPAQSVMAWIFIGCVPIHVFEAWYAYRLARRLSLVKSAVGWSVQCFLLGYPSTHLLRKRARAAA